MLCDYAAKQISKIAESIHVTHLGRQGHIMMSYLCQNWTVEGRNRQRYYHTENEEEEQEEEEGEEEEEEQGEHLQVQSCTFLVSFPHQKCI